MPENIILSELNKLEQKELLEYMKHYKINMRDSLGLSNNIKFGIEIEAEGKKLKELLINPEYRQEHLNSKILMQYQDYFKEAGVSSYNFERCPWILKDDITVKSGAEIHSPILTDTKKNWNELKQICEFLKSLNSFPTDNTAIHTHFNEKSFIEDIYDLYNLIKLYSAYEGVLYKFGTGEFLNFRNRLYTYAAPVAKDFHNAFQGIYFREPDYKKFLRKMNFSYNSGLRLRNLQNDDKETIEFRFANSTLSPEIIQNLVNVEAKLCRYAVSMDFDDDFVTRKFNYMKFPKTNKELANQYLNIPLEEIFEFADLIFDNTLDKLYFIRQCIKKQQPHSEKGLQKVKKFY